MNVLDLFSGIGGFSLGLERAGARTVAFCEIDPYCRAVLARHWPDVPCYDDIRTLSGDRLRADGIAIDAICGGFPCQDISNAGPRRGIDGLRSGLWREYARLIGELRPSEVIVENSADLLARGMDRVLGDLARLGYDAEWHCIPAAALGARHIRNRVWIIAFLPDPARERRLQRWWKQFAQDREAQWDVYQRLNQPLPSRTAHGIPNRSHRVSIVGNSVVPQIPEIIGRAIMRVVK